MRRLATFAALLIGSLLLAVPAAAAPPIIKVSSPMLQMARPGAWVPVYVDVSSTEPFQGTVRVKFAGGDDGDPAHRVFDVSRGGSRRVVVPKRVPAWAYNLEVEVRDRRGRMLKEETLEVRGGAMSPEALRVLVVGEDPLGWPTLQTVTSGPIVGHRDVAQADFRPVLVENLLPPDLPTHWFGWSSVDVLVWSRPDPAALTPEQQAAFSGWIAAGGTAFVALADDHARWTGSPLGDLAPVRPLGMMMSSSARDVLRTLAGNRGALPDTEPVPIVDLAPFAPTETLLTDDSGKPLVLRAAVGGGQLVLTSFDPAAGELSGRVDRELLWRNLFGLWAPRESVADPDLSFEELADARGIEDRGPGLVSPPWPAVAECTAGPQIGMNTADIAGLISPDLTDWTEPGQWWNQLRERLVHFEGAAPLSLGFILVFGLLYLLFIGPLDYFVLRRVGRPMLTWITFPVLAIAFSVAAALIVRDQKGGESEVRCYELHDVVEQAGIERRTSWCSLWAGRKSDLAIRPARGVGFVVPAVGSDYDDDSWYGGWADAINGDDLVSRHAPGVVGLDFEAAQWSASTFRGAWQAPTDEGADWYRSDAGLAVRSRLSMDLEAAVIADGGQWYAVGDLPAGGLREAHARSAPPDLADDDLETAWSLLADAIEDFGGHIHPGAPGSAVLVGFHRTSTPGLRVDGFTADQSSVTLVRVPLTPLAEVTP
jgi:hypothetical protein